MVGPIWGPILGHIGGPILDPRACKMGENGAPGPKGPGGRCPNPPGATWPHPETPGSGSSQIQAQTGLPEVFWKALVAFWRPAVVLSGSACNALPLHPPFRSSATTASSLVGHRGTQGPRESLGLGTQRTPSSLPLLQLVSCRPHAPPGPWARRPGPLAQGTTPAQPGLWEN